ncbi:MAG: hypothetical protein R3F31_20535 [Verrucomicrobiales bacterium]
MNAEGAVKPQGILLRQKDTKFTRLGAQHGNQLRWITVTGSFGSGQGVLSRLPVISMTSGLADRW